MLELEAADAGLVLDRELTVLLEMVVLIRCPSMLTPVSSRICWHLESRESRRVRFMCFMSKMDRRDTEQRITEILNTNR